MPAAFDDSAVLFDATLFTFDGEPQESPFTGDSWQVLPGCKCFRCCCCPPTVFYPPTLSVFYKIIDADGHPQSLSFPVSCVWPDCPRGTEFLPDTVCEPPDFGPPPPGPCYDPVEGVCKAYVERCHGCSYTLLDPDTGSPNYQLVFVESGGGGDGGQPFNCYRFKAGTPRLYAGTLLQVYGPAGGDVRTHMFPFMPDDTQVYWWITGFGFGCDFDRGDLFDFPAIATYVNPDTGVGYGWRGGAEVWLMPDMEFCIFDETDPSSPSNPFNPAPQRVDFNRGVWVGDGSAEYPNPPFQFFNPLDPWKFNCCPLRVRFLFGQFEPIRWCDQETGDVWPDPSEWPPLPGGYVPWNFPVPLCNDRDGVNGCGAFYTHTACGCTGTVTWNCDQSTAPDFGYVEITGGASCWSGPADVTNCLNAMLPDDDSHAC